MSKYIQIVTKGVAFYESMMILPLETWENLHHEYMYI